MYDFFKDACFRRVRTILDNRIKQLQQSHDFDDNRAVPFTRQDLHALLKCSAADPSTPRGLILRTFLLIAMNTGKRISTHHDLLINDFELETDPESGREFYFITSRPDKKTSLVACMVANKRTGPLGFGRTPRAQTTVLLHKLRTISRCAPPPNTNASTSLLVARCLLLAPGSQHNR